ncbi:MAG: phytoene desaturase family protein [bacterium]
MTKKKIVIIGAGPGGLTAGMILAHRGFDVHIYEKAAVVGGRNAAIKLGDYTFDTGPTFLMMKFILDEMFEETGRKSSDYLDIKQIEPMYRLIFDKMEFSHRSNMADMVKEMDAKFPGESKNLSWFMKEEGERFEKMFPCLQKDYSSFKDMFWPTFLKAIPFLALDRSLYNNLARYFKNEFLRLSFTFQAKYLGMSAWECPAAFTIIPYIEHKWGIHHPIGGVNRISHAMADVIKEEGGKINLNTPVKQILTVGKKAVGVELENGEKIMADEVVINADFSYATTHLFEKGLIKKYTKPKLLKRKYSCSIMTMYLGVKKQYDLPHHNVFFAKDYKANVKNIFNNLKLSQDTSFYIQNASLTDPTLAPKGKSTLYVLIPVPNKNGKIDWKVEKDKVRENVLNLMETRAGLKDLRQNIEVEKIYTPDTWDEELNVFLGATFNLGHNLPQMLYFRPRNQFEEVDNVYLTGGGTHPGSGLPTIYESGRISANLICKKYGVSYKDPLKTDRTELFK